MAKAVWREECHFFKFVDVVRCHNEKEWLRGSPTRWKLRPGESLQEDQRSPPAQQHRAESCATGLPGALEHENLRERAKLQRVTAQRRSSDGLVVL